MNNFRNPYVDPDSFQGKIYNNYRNPTNPQSIHFSLNNHGGFEQKETQQNQKNNQYGKTKKHSIYINHQLEKITDSKLVMFSPPKVDSIQEPLDEEPIDELAFNIALNKHSENEKKDKEEVVSTLVKEFSHMLEDNPSIQEDKVENDTLSDESTSNKLRDEYTNNENTTEHLVHTRHENSEMLLAEFHSMLDEWNDDLISEGEDIKSSSVTNDTIDDNFLLMFLESEELQEENQDSDTNDEDIETLKEPTDPMEEKYLTMLSESDELQEENQAILMNEEDIDALNETNDHHMEEKFFTMLSESDELQEEKQDSLFANLKEIKSDKIEDLSNLKDTHFITYVEKKKTTTVKMQVLLTRLETEIDIIETIDLLMSLENIVKVEWSIQSLDCRVVIPSKTVFLKGEFIAEIEFSNKGLENRIQSMKVSIPWSKISNINWLAVPDFSHSNQYEYMFQSPHEPNPNFHYKSHLEFAEPIISQLNQINFVWHQEINQKDQHLQINGFAQLSISFMQEQFVELDCYSK